MKTFLAFATCITLWIGLALYNNYNNYVNIDGTIVNKYIVSHPRSTGYIIIVEADGARLKRSLCSSSEWTNSNIGDKIRINDIHKSEVHTDYKDPIVPIWGVVNLYLTLIAIGYGVKSLIIR